MDEQAMKRFIDSRMATSRAHFDEWFTCASPVKETLDKEFSDLPQEFHDLFWHSIRLASWHSWIAREEEIAIAELARQSVNKLIDKCQQAQNLADRLRFENNQLATDNRSLRALLGPDFTATI